MAVYNTIEHDGRVQRSAEALSEEYDVTVTAIGSNARFEPDGYSVVRARLPALGRLKGIRHVLFWLRLCVLAVRLRPAVVYAHDFFVAWPGAMAARLVRARFVYDSHELIVPGAYVPEPRSLRFFYVREKQVIARAACVIAANANRAELMREHYGLAKTPVAVRNIPDRPRSVIDDAECRRQYPELFDGGVDAVRLVYQGDMYLLRGIGAFVRAMKHLDDVYRLVLVGDGPDRQAIRDIALRDGVAKRISVLGRIPHEHLHDVLRQCDMGIVTYPAEGLNNVYCAPNKTYEYAHAGLPMISTSQPPLRDLFSAYDVGVLVDHECPDSEELSKSIADAAERTRKNHQLYEAGLREFLGSVNWEEEARKLVRAVVKTCE